MKQRVFIILSQIMGLPVEEIREDSSPDTIEAWDSLRHMNLVLALEEAFGIQFTEEEIVEMLNVQLIVDILKDKKDGSNRAFSE